MRRTTSTMTVVLAVVLTVAGCAEAPVASDPPAASPSPSVLCPGFEAAEAADGCIPRDPEAAMAENESYRERGPISSGADGDAEALVAQVTTALEALAAGSDPVTADSVAAALIASGVAADGIQTQEGVGVAFGAATSFGCVFGGVGPQGVQVDSGGAIADGGCLPARGH